MFTILHLIFLCCILRVTHSESKGVDSVLFYRRALHLIADEVIQYIQSILNVTLSVILTTATSTTYLFTLWIWRFFSVACSFYFKHNLFDFEIVTLNHDWMFDIVSIYRYIRFYMIMYAKAEFRSHSLSRFVFGLIKIVAFFSNVSKFNSSQIVSYFLRGTCSLIYVVIRYLFYCCSLAVKREHIWMSHK